MGASVAWRADVLAALPRSAQRKRDLAIAVANLAICGGGILGAEARNASTTVRHAPTLNPDDDGKPEHSLTNRVQLVKHALVRSDAIQIDTKRKLLPYPLEHT